MSIKALPAIIAVLTMTSFGATYKGKSIDGRTYNCMAKTGREIHPCSIVFGGKSGHLKMRGGIYTIRLSSETIDDPKQVPAYLEGEIMVLDIDISD